MEGDPRSANPTTPERPGVSTQWEFLRQEVDRQLAIFRRRRRRDKRKAFALQMATVTLSATVTVLLGVRTADPTRTWLSNVALALGALITVLAAAEAFFSHRRLWVLRTATVRRLETLSRHLDFYSPSVHGEPTQAVLGDCLTELDAIVAEDQTRWEHLRETVATQHNRRSMPAPVSMSPSCPGDPSAPGNAHGDDPHDSPGPTPADGR